MISLKIAIPLLVVMVTAGYYFTNSALSSQDNSLKWSPIQTGTVRETSANSISVLEKSGALLFINTTTSCPYQPGDQILYRISSYDYSINTQHIQIVNSPGTYCTAQSPS